LSNVTLVAPDRDVALRLSEKFGATATIVQVHICAFFEQASATASKFDLICATDLPDQSSIEDLNAFLCTAQTCLSETGKIQLASFLPDHLGSGWRTVCLNWALHCFQESDLVQLGQAVGLHTSTYRDAANCVAWSEFSKTKNSNSWGARNYGH
jgi:predicted TPR repeat methyltransferase